MNVQILWKNDWEQGDGRTLQYHRVSLPAHRPGPPLHYHVASTETLTCVEGTLDMYFGRDRGPVRLHVGESVSPDIGQPHTFANTSSSPCVMTVQTRPAGVVEPLRKLDPKSLLALAAGHALGGSAVLRDCIDPGKYHDVIGHPAVRFLEFERGSGPFSKLERQTLELDADRFASMFSLQATNVDVMIGQKLDAPLF